MLHLEWTLGIYCASKDNSYRTMIFDSDILSAWIHEVCYERSAAKIRQPTMGKAPSKHIGNARSRFFDMDGQP